MLAPITEYQRLGENSDEHDLRLRWDVELTIGKSTHLVRISGMSVMQELVSPSQIHLASGRLDAELVAKIVVPALAKIQALMNQKGVEMAESLDHLPMIPAMDNMVDGLPDMGTEDVALEAELIAQAEPEA